MALSKQTPQTIIEIVAADTDCQKAIQTSPSTVFLNPGTGLFLRFSHLSGSVRNAAMMLQGKYTGDKEFDEKICLGIALVTFKASLGAIKQRRLPELHTANSTHRVHWGTHHEATWIRMKDDSQYAFDWHATLKLRDSVISKLDDWQKGQNGITYCLFSGFK